MSKKNDDFFKEKKIWSEIKDQLLGCYLVPYFSKISYTKKPILYVDGFAGKGMFDDGKAGSPIIALDIINNRIEKAQPNKVIIKSFFIELKHSGTLKSNICRYENTVIISGKYEDNIEKILQVNENQNQNVFLYIDPYGIKSLHFSVFNKLNFGKFNSFELLMNMNSFGFIRAACYAMNVIFDIPELEDVVGLDQNIYTDKSIQDLNDVAGGDYWQEIIEEFRRNIISGYEAEKKFTEQYCNNLGKVFKYVLNMPIRLKKDQHPKYRMIHATNHEQGCILMNDNMCKRWEALKYMQNSGQMTMFEQDSENNIIDEVQLNCLLRDKVKYYLEYTNLNVFYADLFKEIGVKYSSGDISKQLNKLEKDNVIQVYRHPKISPKGKKSTFWTVGKGQTIKIRCV